MNDHNILHPNSYKLLDNIDNDKICGNHTTEDLCKNGTWKLDIYEADGYYSQECYDNNKDTHVYIDDDLWYYNKIA